MILNNREAQILNFIKKHIRVNGYSPTVREIGQAINVKSTNTVHQYLNRLEKEGAIKRTPSISRSIVLAKEVS